mgnify:CR=1 FL=1
MPSTGDDSRQLDAERPANCQLQIWHSATGVDHRGPFEIRCEKLLNSGELANADRFRRVTTRNQHIVGRAMARRLLGDERVAPHSIEFSAGQYGKPHVLHPKEANQPFNIAHTDGLVLFGIADQEAELVGVDVECTDRRTSTELAERYFSKPEIEFLRTQPMERQKYFFLRIWTLKEAFIKAIGTGLHTPLADFAFERIDSSSPSINFLPPYLNEDRNWNFIVFEPRNGFIASAAVAAKRKNSKVGVHWRAFESLLEEP